jgi:DNA invertase Pin-like site-specific DNA recombinase
LINRTRGPWRLLRQLWLYGGWSWWVLRSQVVSYDPAKIKKMKDDRMGPSEIAKTLKIGRASVYRALGR